MDRSLDAYLGRPKTARYRPGILVPTQQVIDHRGLFTLREVELMRRDPRLEFGLTILASPLPAVKWTVRARHLKVAQYVDRTIRRVWRTALPRLCESFVFGFAGGENIWHKDERTGQVEWQELRDVHALHLRALECMETGDQVGCRIQGGGTDVIDLYRPRAFWVVNEGKHGSYYGKSRLRGAWVPWKEKTARHGALDIRRTWYLKNAYRGGTLRHPGGTLIDGQGRTVACQDYAREVVEKMETGGVLTLPNDRDDNGNYEWEFDPPTPHGDIAGVAQYVKDLGDEEMEGMGIPKEVVEATATGSGWSGRSVPFIVFLTKEDQIVADLFAGILKWVVAPGVAVNYPGEEGHVEVDPVSLVPPDEQSGPPQGVPGQGGGGGQGRTAWEPYEGPNGGKGLKDPATGKIWYGATIGPGGKIVGFDGQPISGGTSVGMSLDAAPTRWTVLGSAAGVLYQGPPPGLYLSLDRPAPLWLGRGQASDAWVPASQHPPTRGRNAGRTDGWYNPATRRYAWTPWRPGEWRQHVKSGGPTGRPQGPGGAPGEPPPGAGGGEGGTSSAPPPARRPASDRAMPKGPERDALKAALAKRIQGHLTGGQRIQAGDIASVASDLSALTLADIKAMKKQMGQAGGGRRKDEQIDHLTEVLRKHLGVAGPTTEAKPEAEAPEAPPTAPTAEVEGGPEAPAPAPPAPAPAAEAKPEAPKGGEALGPRKWAVTDVDEIGAPAPVAPKLGPKEWPEWSKDDLRQIKNSERKPMLRALAHGLHYANDLTDADRQKAFRRAVDTIDHMSTEEFEELSPAEQAEYAATALEMARAGKAPSGPAAEAPAPKAEAPPAPKAKSNPYLALHQGQDKITDEQLDEVQKYLDTVTSKDELRGLIRAIDPEDDPGDNRPSLETLREEAMATLVGNTLHRRDLPRPTPPKPEASPKGQEATEPEEWKQELTEGMLEGLRRQAGGGDEEEATGQQEAAPLTGEDLIRRRHEIRKGLYPELQRQAGPPPAGPASPEGPVPSELTNQIMEALARAPVTDLAELRRSLPPQYQGKDFDRAILQLADEDRLQLAQDVPTTRWSDEQRRQYVAEGSVENGAIYTTAMLKDRPAPPAAEAPPGQGGPSPTDRQGGYQGLDPSDNHPILAGMRKINPAVDQGAPISLAELRQALRGTYKTKEAFDKAVLDMADQNELALQRHDQPSFLTDAERNRLVRDENGEYYTAALFRDMHPDFLDSGFRDLDTNGDNQVRVDELARELNVTPKRLIAFAQQHGYYHAEAEGGLGGGPQHAGFLVKRDRAEAPPGQGRGTAGPGLKHRKLVATEVDLAKEAKGLGDLVVPYQASKRGNDGQFDVVQDRVTPLDDGNNPSKVSDEVYDGIRDLIREFWKKGYVLGDFAPENLAIHNGKLKVLDLDAFTHKEGSDFDSVEQLLDVAAKFFHRDNAADRLPPKVDEQDVPTWATPHIEDAPDHARPALRRMAQSLAGASHLDERQRDQYLQASIHVLGRMPAKAVERLERGSSEGIIWASSPEDVAARVLDLYRDNPEVTKAFAGKKSLGGIYAPSRKRVIVDGGYQGVRRELNQQAGRPVETAELQAHEYTHSIDGPDSELSLSPEWNKAWKAELANKQFNDYAALMPQEGLAEFGRILYAGGHDLVEARKKYPQCWAFFEKHGLAPDINRRPTGQTIVDLFDERIPIGDPDGPDHADQLKKGRS